MEPLYIQPGNTVCHRYWHWIQSNQCCGIWQCCGHTGKLCISTVLPNSVHVLCLAHIVNLAAEVFHHHCVFTHTCNLVTIMSLHFPRSQEESPAFWTTSTTDVKLPPVSVSTRWNSWLAAVIYHATRIHLYEGFYIQESSKNGAWTDPVCVGIELLSTYWFIVCWYRAIVNLLVQCVLV